MEDTAEENADGRATSDEASDDAPTVDGRRLRRDRNRDEVIDGLIELIEAGCLAPTAAQIAEQSGMSLRSVFRYFEDREELLAAATATAYERYAPLARIGNFRNGSFEDRLRALVDQRLLLYPALAPVIRAARARSTESEGLMRSLALYVNPLNAQVEGQFGHELGCLGEASGTAAASLVMLFSPDTYELLTNSQLRDHREVRAIYDLTARSLLAPALS